jgi:hypothetical protein
MTMATAVKDRIVKATTPVAKVQKMGLFVIAARIENALFNVDNPVLGVEAFG